MKTILIVVAVLVMLAGTVFLQNASRNKTRNPPKQNKRVL